MKIYEATVIEGQRLVGLGTFVSEERARKAFSLSFNATLTLLTESNDYEYVRPGEFNDADGKSRPAAAPGHNVILLAKDIRYKQRFDSNPFSLEIPDDVYHPVEETLVFYLMEVYLQGSSLEALGAQA